VALVIRDAQMRALVAALESRLVDDLARELRAHPAAAGLDDAGFRAVVGEEVEAARAGGLHRRASVRAFVACALDARAAGPREPPAVRTLG
jgi:hypothetical protein